MGFKIKICRSELGLAAEHRWVKNKGRDERELKRQVRRLVK